MGNKSCKNNSLTSRSYKLPLDVRRFSDPADAMAALLGEISRQAERTGCRPLRSPKKGVVPNERLVHYFDTPERLLYNAGFILRRRVEMNEGAPDRTQLTLKYRSPDPILARMINPEPKGKKGTCTFQEGILPPYSSRFSRAGSLPYAPNDPVPGTMAGLRRLFPKGLRPFARHDADPLTIVNGFTAHATLIKGHLLPLTKGCVADVGFNFWRCPASNELLVASLDFTLAMGEQGISPKSAARMLAIYEGLHAIKRWRAPKKAHTKTGLAFEGRILCQ